MDKSPLLLTDDEFRRGISTQFCSNYSLEIVTAMPSGLHDRFCHAFPVDDGMILLLRTP